MTSPFHAGHRLLQALCLAAVCAAGAAHAAFPEKPVTLVVPYPPGGATDTVARIMAKGLTARLGQTVIVDNKAGAGTVIGAGAVAQAQPDGYTLLISSNTTFTINPALKAKLPYEPLKSFESIGVIGSSPLVLIAHPSLPANSVAELVVLAKAQPGKLSYASFGAGTTSHFAGEMFKLMTGAAIVHVPYKGSAPAMQDLIGGQVQIAFDTNVASIPQIRAGKVKGLAVTSRRPSASLPGLPSVAQAGYPDYEMVPWITIVAPRGLPAATRGALAKAFADTVKDAGIRAELDKAGVDVAYEPGSAYDERVARELPLLRAYVHKAALTVE